MSALVLSIVLLNVAVPRTLDVDAPKTPAERAIQLAERATLSSSNKAEAWSELALAFARRARETADHTYYRKAEAAIDRSLELSPGNLEALKARAWVRLGGHDFEGARALARELAAKVPDDIVVQGVLADANAELGRYPEAEEAAQWMLDLRPGNVPGLTRAAYLRELFGDVDGALELFAQAFTQVPETESEDRAWILTQMAHLHAGVGRRDVAAQLLDEAMALFPGYHYALAQRAHVLAGQGRFAEAVAAMRQRYDQAPHPENLFDLAVALRRAGNEAEAKAAFARFEEEARAEMEGPDNANRELAFYYADHAHRPLEALRVAEGEAKRRRDVFTLDAYAWALHRTGRSPEARKEMEQALAVGVKQAAMLYRAGVIAAAAGDAAAARVYLGESLRLDAASEVAIDARGQLLALSD